MLCSMMFNKSVIKKNIYIDSQMTPLIQKMQRVPFSLKDKVTANINELLEHDIIEKVEDPTRWVSPVAVIPKSSEDIRYVLT